MMHGSSVSRHAARMGSTAFLAVAVGTDPSRRVGPWMMNLSIAHIFLGSEVESQGQETRNG